MDGKAELVKQMRKVAVLAVATAVVVACLLAGTISVAQAQEPVTSERQAGTQRSDTFATWAVISAAICVVGATLGASYAVARVGSAALGAASEKPEIMFRALVFVALAEGLVVFGTLIALLLILVKI